MASVGQARIEVPSPARASAVYIQTLETINLRKLRHMSMAVKTMPTPMPPPEKRVQWLPLSGKLNGVLNGEGAAEEPTKMQRPQSAVVHSMNRRLSTSGANAEARTSSEIIKIAFEVGENARREIVGRSTEARPHTSGGEGSGSSTKNRPMSAMASISRGGIASTAEKADIEELKREIMEVAKRINNNRKELQQSDAKVSSALARVTSVDETENALKRFITTSDPAQMQMAKNALLCMVLQKHEELYRDTLCVLNLQHEGAPSDAAASRSSSGSSMVSARDRTKDGLPRSRSGVMLALVDRTKSLSSQISQMKHETSTAASELHQAKSDIKKLTEERELLRATLTQAGRSGSASIKIVRPVSAPRARAPPALAEHPSSARVQGGCDGCELLEIRTRDTHLLLQAAEESNKTLSEKIAALNEEKSEWQRRAPAKKGEIAPPAPHQAKPEPAPATNSDNSKEMAALKKKVTELEKALSVKVQQVHILDAHLRKIYFQDRYSSFKISSGYTFSNQCR